MKDQVVIVQVPIKTNSERIPGKNFKEYKEKPLFCHLLDKLYKKLPSNWVLVVDTDTDYSADLIKQYYPEIDIFIRDPFYSSNKANGNHLLSNFAANFNFADIYVQAFVTAPDLTLETIKSVVNSLINNPGYNSSTLFTEECGWVWFNNKPVNYDYSRMDGLPRSQDAPYLKETTGVYAVRKEALQRTGCRLADPVYKIILNDETEAKDIDRPQDLK